MTHPKSSVSVALVCASLMFAPDVVAQSPKYLLSPIGAELQGGGGPSGVPFQNQSATYQQIHDYDELIRLNSGKTVVVKGLGFRVSGKASAAGRSWEVRIAMGTTTTASANISPTFSNNMLKPTYVVGSSTSYAKHSFKTIKGTGDPNPIGLSFPFSGPFLYLPKKGSHLVWQWQHTKGTKLTFAADSFVNFYGSHPGTVKPSFGKGCNAWSDAQVMWVGGSYIYQNTLSGAPGNVATLAFIGFNKQQTKIPGWCAPLEILPTLQFWNKTNAAGQWKTSFGVTLFKGLPTIPLYVQYAFADKRRPGGVGLSTTSHYLTPMPGVLNVYSVYVADTTSTKGQVVFGGLITGFLQ